MNRLVRAWAEVDLDAISHNIKEIRKITSPKAKIMGIVKADGYGHGYLEVTRTLLENGVDMLGVAILDEARQLRANGIDVPILILGSTDPCQAKDVVELGVIPSVFNLELPMALSEAAKAVGKKVNIHIKIDTGMNRVGFLAIDRDTVKNIIYISRLPNIKIDGIFTHFARADESDHSYTYNQFNKFMSLCAELEKNGIYIPIKHACNSAALIQFPEMHLDLVRPGIIMYGCYPSEYVDKTKIDLKPAMTLKSTISHIKEVEANSQISYGGTYTTTRRTKVATVSIGYADGYYRSLSNKAYMIAGGEKVPVIGKVCMDQCMIDVTNVKNIAVGDEVVLFGRKGNVSIPVEELAEIAGTINYEMLCVIGKRIPRVYIQNGDIVEVLDYLV